MNYQITIALPVYERVEYFEQALASALAQSVPCAILVVDNASQTDFFRRVCEQYPGRIHYFRQVINIGMFANWNTCARLVQTPYFVILGDDDVLDPAFAEQVLASWAAHPDAQFVYAKFRYVGTEPSSLPPPPPWPPFGRTSVAQVRRAAARRGLGFPVVCVCHKTSTLMEYPWREAPHGSSDWVMLYELPNHWVCFGIEQILLDYRKHPGADTANSRSKLLCDLSHAWIYRRLASLHWRAYLRFWTKFLPAFHNFCAARSRSEQFTLESNYYIDSLLTEFWESRLIRWICRDNGPGKLTRWLLLLCYRGYLWRKGINLKLDSFGPSV